MNEARARRQAQPSQKFPAPMSWVCFVSFCFGATRGYLSTELGYPHLDLLLFFAINRSILWNANMEQHRREYAQQTPAIGNRKRSEMMSAHRHLTSGWAHVLLTPAYPRSCTPMLCCAVQCLTDVNSVYLDHGIAIFQCNDTTNNSIQLTKNGQTTRNPLPRYDSIQFGRAPCYLQPPTAPSSAFALLSPIIKVTTPQRHIRS